MIDNKLTEKIQAWLTSPHDSADEIREGALLLLKLNRNRCLYDTICRRPERYVKKVEYELKKFMPMRLAQMTMQQTLAMEEELMPEVNAAIEADNDETAPGHKGKRSDHDSLPEDIQAIWQRNADRWKKIKELQAKCLLIEDPCDRFESVKQLKDIWYAYKSDFAVYDDYVSPAAVTEGEAPQADTTDLMKDIDNKKKYLYKNLEELKARKEAALADDADAKAIKKYESLKLEMTSRAVFLLEQGVELSDDVLSRLAEGGVVIGRKTEEQSPATDNQ